MSFNPGKNADRTRKPRLSSGDMYQQRNRNQEYLGMGNPGQTGDGGGNGNYNAVYRPRYRPAIGRGSYSRPPPILAPNSANRVKLGKHFPNPFASKMKVLKRLKSHFFATQQASNFPQPGTSSSFPGFPPKKPAVTTHDLRKQMERRRVEKAKAEESSSQDKEIRSPAKKAKEDDAASIKVPVRRDEDEESGSSTTVQICGVKKNEEKSPKTSCENKGSTTKNPILVTISSDEEEKGSDSPKKENRKDPKLTKSLQVTVEKLKLDSVSRKVTVKLEPEAKAAEMSPRKGHCETKTALLASPAKISRIISFKSESKSKAVPSISSKEEGSKVVTTKDVGMGSTKGEEQPVKRVDISDLCFEKGQPRKDFGNQNPFRQWKTGLGGDNETAVFSTGKVLLPTPPLAKESLLFTTTSQYQRTGQGKGTNGGDNGKGGDNSGNGSAGGGWLTYNQVKNTELTYQHKRKPFFRGNSTASKFQSRQTNQRDREWGTTTTDKTEFGISQYSLDAESKDGKQTYKRFNKEASSSSAPFDPYQPISLMPSQPSAVTSLMYESMLATAQEICQPTLLKFRNAWEVGKFAECKSFGSFLTTESKHGNCLMPIMPRIEPPSLTK